MKQLICSLVISILLCGPNSVLAACPANFFTEDGDIETKTSNNTCDSYSWSWGGTDWSKSGPLTGCVVASKKVVKLQSRINGDALSSRSSGGVLIISPGGQVTGTVCEGA